MWHSLMMSSGHASASLSRREKQLMKCTGTLPLCNLSGLAASAGGFAARRRKCSPAHSYSAEKGDVEVL
ncbi:hypothetical protein Y1Q_0005233 [Alligator mississippiensis]|uniref:Uncharacterized protein n=1 Tax=Alligator mississippiensis TaxID=8496 RepID=A0A151MT45_ALLMI|nr:hypothetical protein Y1Q_0005233 [Alligator mississippiensis]